MEDTSINEAPETEAHEQAEGSEQDAPDSSPQRSAIWMHKFIGAAKAASKKYWRDGRDAWNEYLCTQAQIESASALRYQSRKKYRIYWSSVRSMQPAFYCRTPQIVASRMFDVDDPVARVACTLAERLGQHLLKGGEFDATMCAIRDDFIMTEKATGRVYFEADIQQEQIQQEIAEGVDGIQQEPQYEDVMKSIKVCTLPICFDDIVHTPYAKHWDEITELGWRVPMTKDAFKARFGVKKAALVSFSTKVNEHEDKSDDYNAGQMEANVDQTAQAADAVTWVWEIWCKNTRKVYWVSENYTDGFLDVKPDPYDLVGFFPMAPFIIGTKPDKSMYPVPMYVPLRPLIEQLHSLINKVFDLIAAVRRRAIADGGCEDLITAINNLDDNEVIAVQNFAQIVEKGGIANLIQYLPVQELSNAIVELQGLTAVFKNEFFEFSGVPDLLRGSSDPIETAAAQQQKGNFLTLRFSWPQKQIQAIARDLIEMMVDLALKKFPDDYLAQVCGVQNMPPEDQQFVPQAVQLLRDDKTRVVRIDIETDSTSYLKEMQQQRDKQMVAQTVMQGLKEIAAISQSSPTLASTALSVLLFTLRSMNLGKSFESEITASVGQMQQQAEQQAQAAASAPPPPDYEQMKIQLQQQKMQIDQQWIAIEQQKMQAGVQLQQAELQIKQQAEQQKLLIEQEKLRLEASKQQADSAIDAQELQIKAQEVNSNIEMKGVDAALKQQTEQVKQMIESGKLEVEKLKVQLTSYEALLEERRLAMDAQMKEREIAATKTQQLPPINIQVDASKPQKRTGKITRDELGNAILTIDSEA